MDRKRTYEKLDEPGSEPLKSLKAKSILIVFNGMALEERQALIPELLEKARIVNGYALNCVSPEFVRLMCSGDCKEWPTETVELAWVMWNFIYRRARGGELYCPGDRCQKAATVWSSNFNSDDPIDIFYDERAESATRKLSREQFFDTILKEYTLDMLSVMLRGGDYSQTFYGILEDNPTVSEFQNMMEDELIGGYHRDLIPDP